MNFEEKSIRVRLSTKLKIVRARQSLKVFGNTLGIRINVLYFIHHFICRLQSKKILSTNRTELAAISHEAGLAASTLRKNGIVKLDPINVDELSQEIFEYFKMHPCTDGVGFVDKSTALTFTSSVSNVLTAKIKATLTAYYKCPFQTYWVNFMRYETGISRGPDSSFGFHIDDNPKQLLKIFIYLNDTFESNAAFRAFDYAATRMLIDDGFISCSSELRRQAQSLIGSELIKNELKIFEGVKGTVLIFDNNLVHRGAMPREGYRDVLVVEVYPCHQYPTLESIQRSLSAPIVRDYPVNPFFNDVQEYCERSVGAL